MAIAKYAKGFLPRNRFVRSVSVLAAGSAAGQVVVVLASPLLTRLYSPADFGLLAVFASLLGILGVVASLRYQLAIPLPDSDEEAIHVTVLSLLIVLATTTMTVAVVVPFAPLIAETTRTPALAGYIWLLPVGLLLTGVYQVFNYWAIRTKAFGAIARTKLTQSVSMVVVQMGGYALGPLALLAGRILGQAMGLGALAALMLRTLWGPILETRIPDLRRAASRYRHFPLYSSWSGLLNSGGIQAPPILLAILYGSSAAGLYMLAHRILSMPMTLVGNAIADVFMPHSVVAFRESRLSRPVASLHSRLAHLAMPPAILIFIAGPELFRVIFGPEWEEAGHIARWLAPVLFIQFVVSPLSRIFVVVEKQRLGLILQSQLFLARILSIGLAAFLGFDLLGAVGAFSASSFLGFSIYVIALARVTGNRTTGLVRAWGSAFLVGLLANSPLFVAQLLGSGGGAAFFAATVLTLVAIMACWALSYRTNGEM